MEIEPTEVRDEWNAKFIEMAEREYQIRYTCPTCATPIMLNVAFGPEESEVSTELWCHRDSIGAAVTLGPLEVPA